MLDDDAAADVDLGQGGDVGVSVLRVFGGVLLPALRDGQPTEVVEERGLRVGHEGRETIEIGSLGHVACCLLLGGGGVV